MDATTKNGSRCNYMKKKERTEAIALKYNEESDKAPVIIASGKGVIAQSIIENGKNAGLPIYEDAALAEVLTKLPVNESIPEELYEVVAEIFSFVYQLDGKYANTKK